MKVAELIIVGLLLGTVLTVSIIVLAKALIEYGRELGNKKDK